MLTKEEYKFNLWLLDRLSKLGVFPLEVDRDRARIKRQSSRLKLGVWSIYMTITSLHFLYISGRLLQTLIFRDQFVLSYFTLHFNYVVGSLMSLSWYALNFVICPDIPVILFNETFNEEDVQVQNHNWQGPQKRTSLLEFSIQEVLATVLEPCHLFCGLTVTIASVANPDMKLLLYTGLREEWQSPTTFALLLGFEYLLLVFWTNSIYFTLQVQILFFEKLTSTLRSFTAFQRKTASKLTVEKCYKQLQRISLLIKLFNSSNASIIFILKIVCLLFGVVSGFFAIQYFSLNPALGLYNYAISIDMSILFAVTFEKAFFIPDRLDSFKKEVQVKAKRLSLPKEELRHIEKLIRSVPNSGIKVGDFKNFERVSTPEFIDFVVRNIAVLLVTK